MAVDLAIEVAGLEKSFGAVSVLSGVDLTVRRGSVFALLGPNGSGKTTTVRILATLSRADAGVARVAGLDVVHDRHRVRRRISLTGQYAAIDGLQTGEENLRMMAWLCGLRGRQASERAGELLDRFGLADAGRRRVKTYSGGMRRRLDLAASLVGRPSVIFLDEPTTGLDVRSRQAMWEVVTDLAGSGVTVFLTTQYLEEADRLADRVAVLDGGRVIAEGTSAELKARVAGYLLDLTAVDATAFGELVRAAGGRAASTDPAALNLGVTTDGTAPDVRALLGELDPAGERIGHFTIRTATLDDVFITLTGHAAEPGHTRPTEETVHV
ncbi:ATP-binding cassette domain-containing protein [Qaidamihabitans albus]|uniref:ATP-binding cassette domain-containing protein n=1 Tax=Qaidamihabitans albus TaxID=2795733 RepID=UPI0018F1B25D|nr:ATP-binding cassette domain-containing protein [Qaidamihabitans albus]